MANDVSDAAKLAATTIRAFFQAPVPPELDRRQAFMRRVQYAEMIYDDEVPDDKPDSWWGPSQWFDDKVKQKLCTRVNGHVATDDQCGKPAHRYCMNCNMSMPFAHTPKLTWRFKK